MDLALAGDDLNVLALEGCDSIGVALEGYKSSASAPEGCESNAKAQAPFQLHSKGQAPLQLHKIGQKAPKTSIHQPDHQISIQPPKPQQINSLLIQLHEIFASSRRGPPPSQPFASQRPSPGTEGKIRVLLKISLFFHRLRISIHDFASAVELEAAKGIGACHASDGSIAISSFAKGNFETHSRSDCSASKCVLRPRKTVTFGLT